MELESRLTEAEKELETGGICIFCNSDDRILHFQLDIKWWIVWRDPYMLKRRK